MASFVDPSHKVIAKRRSAFSALSSAQNESESKGEDKKWRINTNFHKWKEIWIYKKNLKPIPISKKSDSYGIVCLCSSIMCSKNFFKKKPKVNLILSHANHTFFSIGPSNWTLSLLDTLIVPLNIYLFIYIYLFVYIMWRRVQFKVQFALNWSLGFWSLDPCLKWSLKDYCWNSEIFKLGVTISENSN